jgi:hypothetical protein
VGNFNIQLSSIYRSSKQKNNKQRNFIFNCNIAQTDLEDIYRIFYPVAEEYPFFSAAHGALTKTDHIPRHKASINEHKKN